MSIATIRKVASRKFRPCLVTLEQRFTPAINTLAVTGLTPGLGGASTVSIVGFVNESSAMAASTLSLSYTVTDTQGHVLASGPLTVSLAIPNSNLYGFLTTIPRSVAPGNSEIINVSATDADSAGVPTTVAANLFISPKLGLSTVGLGVTDGSGDVYAGIGQGCISVTQSAKTGLVAKGNSAFQLTSSPSNQSLVNARAKGMFRFGIDPAGDVSLKLTRTKAMLNFGSYAGGPIGDGGFSGSLSGNLSFTRFANSSISALLKGAVSVSAQIGGSTPTSSGATIVGRSPNVAIGVTLNSAGILGLNGAGRLKLSANINTNS